MPLHPFTKPGILVKIGPLGSVLPGLESRPLIKIKKKTLGKYIAISRKFTERAKQCSILSSTFCITDLRSQRSFCSQYFGRGQSFQVAAVAQLYSNVLLHLFCFYDLEL